LTKMPAEQTALSEKERKAVEQVAEQRGITFEEASEQLAKEGLASRVKRKTGKLPARVYEIRRKA
jgi:predicted kinase